MATLTFENGTVIEISSLGNKVIGREGDCEIKIPDPSLSRNHCKIGVLEDGKFFISDLGSTNGTQINGELLPANEFFYLEDGDNLLIGKVKANFNFKANENIPLPINSPNEGASAYDSQLIQTPASNFDKDGNYIRTYETEETTRPAKEVKSYEYQQLAQQERKKELATKPQLMYARYWKRAVGNIIDGSALLVVNLIIVFCIMGTLIIGKSDPKAASASGQLIANGICLTLNLAYFIGMPLLVKGKTLGKLIMGLSLLRKEGKEINFFSLCKRHILYALIVFGLYLISAIVSFVLLAINPALGIIGFIVLPLLVIGFFVWGLIFMPTSDRMKRAIHDVIGGTVVVEDAA